MPIYEYTCNKCGRTLSFLVRNLAEHKPPACPKCGHPEMRRALSRFSAVTGSKAAAHGSALPEADPAGGIPGAPPDDMGDGPGGMPDFSALDGVDENDPRAMGRALRKMSEQAGEPMDAEMRDVVRRLEAGEDPEKIGEDMGAEDEGAGGGGGGSDDLYDG